MKQPPAAQFHSTSVNCFISRPALQRFLFSRRSPDGAFTMHEGGEVDIRGAYCALSAARLANIATASMFEGTAQWIVG